MPDTLSTSIEYIASTLTSNQNVYKSRLNDGTEVSRVTTGHFFEFELSFRKMTRAEFAPIFAFLASHVGQSFYVQHPDYKTTLGTPSGTPLVNGSSQTGTSLTTDGWTISTNNLLKAGDIISIGSDSKIYMITASVNSNASGQATINIFPSLKSSPADNAVVNTLPYFLVKLKNQQEYSSDNKNVFDYKLSVTEV